MDSSLEIPLFPLNTVLFPGMPLPLHIFEERYKQMIGECLDARSPFGIVLFNENQLCNVGCAAAITQILKQYDDGKLDIMTRGERRFHILDLMQRKPYLEGAIEYFDDDETEDVPNDLLTRVLTQYQEMVKIGTKGIGTVKGIFDPTHFSFVVASTIDLDLGEKQTLLELTSTTARLKKLDEALIGVIEKLQQLRELDRIAGSNGHLKQR